MNDTWDLDELQRMRMFLFDCLNGNETKRAALKVMFRAKNRVSTARINGAIDIIEYQIRCASILQNGSTEVKE